MNFLVILKVLILAKLATSAVVECDFKKLAQEANSSRAYSALNGPEEADAVYSCVVISLETSEFDSFVSEVEGDQLEGMTNDDVSHFKVADQNVEFFPGGLEKIFPNLETVTISRSSLKYVFKADLLGLTNLKFLALSDNEIELLGPGLFEGNPFLEEIHFENNKITKISEDLLDPFETFPSVIQFFNNICIIDDLKSQENTDFKDFIKKNCEMSKIDLIENEDRQIKKLLAKIDSLETSNIEAGLVITYPKEPTSDNKESEVEITKLTNEVKILEMNVTIAYEELQQNVLEMKNLREDNVELKSTIKKLSKNLTETFSEIESLRKECSELDKSYDDLKSKRSNNTVTEDVILMLMVKIAAKLDHHKAESSKLDEKYGALLKEKDLTIEKLEAERDNIKAEKMQSEKNSLVKINRLEKMSRNLNAIITNNEASRASQDNAKSKADKNTPKKAP